MRMSLPHRAAITIPIGTSRPCGDPPTLEIQRVSCADLGSHARERTDAEILAEGPHDLRGDQFQQEVQFIPRSVATEGRGRNERLSI